MVNVNGIISLIILLVLGIIFIVGVTLVVYRVIYNLAIKRRLSQGIADSRQWPSPKSVLLSVLIVILLIIIVISSIGILNQDTPSKKINYNQLCNIVTHTSDELDETAMEIYKNAYNTGKLSGYTKEEQTKGNFHYVCFKSDDGYDALHPAFVMFVEYIGSDDFEGYMDTSSINSDDDSWVYGSSCGETSDYYFVAGNFDYDTISCTYTLGLYNDYSALQKAYDNQILENADEVFEITIDMN
ncbi:MAG: hypothetical protein ACI4HM_04730 [Ruminococcus sp.]